MDPILDLRGVTKVYEGFVLTDVSFALPRGYIMGLVGPNGAGKTTIVKLVLNLVRADAGEIRVLGLDHRRDGVRIRSRIGFVHEHPTFHDHLPAGRAATVVGRFYETWNAGRFRDLAREFGVPLDRPVRRLSRGTRTKFALAVALSHGAELLLLDEPTTGLDPVFRRELLDRLSAVIETGEASVLFSTHITADLDRIADYVTFVRDGRLLMSTTRERLAERWALVKGGLDRLDGRTRALFRGLVESAVAFTGLTDDVDAARRALGDAAIYERASLEDIVFYTSRPARAGGLAPIGDGSL